LVCRAFDWTFNCQIHPTLISSPTRSLNPKYSNIYILRTASSAEYTT
jgi:hypothetical protein